MSALNGDVPRTGLGSVLAVLQASESSSPDVSSQYFKVPFNRLARKKKKVVSKNILSLNSVFTVAPVTA